MKTYLALIPIVILSLMPALGMYIPFNDKVAWFWAFLIIGFLGLYSLTLKIPVSVKAISAILFINVFYSKAPFISQFSYMEFVGCLYLYILCRGIDDWPLVFKALKVILAINLLLFFFQMIGKDSLLNFGFSKSSCVGVVGNPMQFKSYIIVLVALLMQDVKFLRSAAVQTYLSISLIILGFVYAIVRNSITELIIYRGPVWIETIRLALEHPFIGWGVGTYKAIFNSIATLSVSARLEGQWLSAHNDWAQILYECGIPVFIMLVAYAWSLFKESRGVQRIGALLVIYTLTVHFPMRITQVVPLLILFVAYIERIQYGLTQSN
jgi:hypothetical protein